MSMGLMVAAMKLRVGNPLRKLVLLKLADNASDIGECWPSYQHIADQCEISKRSVMNHITALCESGLLRKEIRKGGPKGNSSNVYFLTLDGGAPPAPGVVQQIHQGGASGSPPSESPAPGASAGAAPRTSHSSEPVKEPKPTVIRDQLDGFDKFWKLYPKKKSRKDAAKAWAKLAPNDELQQTLIAALGNHCLSEDWAKDGGRYVPNAATWLNGERWHDELKRATGSAFTNLPQHYENAYPEVPHGQTNF